eukprot:jgi/Psemu1/30706/gm1.30706_g
MGKLFGYLDKVVKETFVVETNTQHKAAVAALEALEYIPKPGAKSEVMETLQCRKAVFVLYVHVPWTLGKGSHPLTDSQLTLVGSPQDYMKTKVLLCSLKGLRTPAVNMLWNGCKPAESKGLEEQQGL